MMSTPTLLPQQEVELNTLEGIIYLAIQTSQEMGLAGLSEEDIVAVVERVSARYEEWESAA
jgi:hypothetical protein